METNVEVRVFSKPAKVAKAVAKEIIDMTWQSAQKRFDIALSGGSTPAVLFDLMAEKYRDRIPWDRLHFWWADERCVPPGSDESNYKLAWDHLFSKVPVTDDHLHRIMGEATPEVEALRYGYMVAQALNNRMEWPVFDLILLGLGEDGHIASIFPNQMELLKSDEICDVAVHPVSGQKRITLTGKTIVNASRIFFMVTGENKAQAVASIMNNDLQAKKFPAYFIAPAHGKLIWFLDEKATGSIG